MSEDPRRAAGTDLAAWLAQVCDDLGIAHTELDVARLLDLAADVAHQVARPAVPLTLYLAGRALGPDASPEDVERVLQQVAASSAAWAQDDA